jgi:hypothetical protein
LIDDPAKQTSNIGTPLTKKALSAAGPAEPTNLAAESTIALLGRWPISRGLQAPLFRHKANLDASPQGGSDAVEHR